MLIRDNVHRRERSPIGGRSDGREACRSSESAEHPERSLDGFGSLPLSNVLNARSDERSAFSGLFRNHWLWAAIGLSLLLHVAVIYVPFLQEAFSTVSLSASDWLRCLLVASSVLWLRELSKFVIRATSQDGHREPSEA